MRRIVLPVLFACLLVLLVGPSRASDTSPPAPAPDRADLALQALLEGARGHSPALARAQAALEGGEARIGGARSAYLPVFGASTRYLNTDNPTMAFMSLLEQGRVTEDRMAAINDPGTVNDWMTSLYARYRLYDFGRRRAGLDAAREDAERLRLLNDAAWRDVRFAVTAAYYDLLRARNAIGLWEETVRLFQAHEDLIRDQFEAGTVLRSDLLQIGVRLAEARENLVSARYQAEIALARLAAVVGVPASEIEVPDRPLGSPPYAADEGPLLVAAREEHPTIEALMAAERAAAYSEKAARRGNWPSLDMEIQGIWHGDDETFGMERDSYAIFILLDFPFYDGGASKAARLEASARRRETEAMRREAADGMELAVRTAHRNTLDAVTRVGIADEAVVAADAALAIIEERYRGGMAKVVDLLEAERALTESRVRALDARAMAWSALAGVERFAGLRGTP